MRSLRALLTAAVLAAALAGPAHASETTIRLGPPTAPDPVVVDAARARVAAGDTAGAIGELAPYVAQHPEDLTAGRLLGDLYFRVPDYKKAESVWTALVRLHPDDRETHNRLGALYAVQDRIDDSIAEFQKSLPSRAGVNGLVAAHKKQGDLGRFVAEVQSDADQHPLLARSWTMLGLVDRALRKFDDARTAFERVVALQPRSCDARIDLANVQVDQGRIDPAMANLSTCLAIDPTYYPAVVNMGEAYLEKHDAKTARPYFDRALQLRPEGSEALVDIGYIFDERGDWKTAVGYYTRAMVADPLRPEAYVDLGYDYSEHRLFPLAEAAYLKGLSVSADDGRLHYMLAVTYNVQGKIALARQQYERAAQADEPLIVNAAKAELALLPPVR